MILKLRANKSSTRMNIGDYGTKLPWFSAPQKSIVSIRNMLKNNE